MIAWEIERLARLSREACDAIEGRPPANWKEWSGTMFISLMAALQTELTSHGIQAGMVSPNDTIMDAEAIVYDVMGKLDRVLNGRSS